HGDGHDAEPPSGASFKAGKGVIVAEETKRLLGLEVADVAQRVVPNQFNLTIQVFGEKHQHGLNQEDHSKCDVHGSAFVPADAADVIKIGQAVQVFENTNGPLG